MTLRRVLAGLGAAATLGAAAAISRRRRALAAVPRELRHPVLLLPLNFGNPLTLAVARRLVPLAGAAVRPGVRVDRRTLPATADDLPVEVLTYRAPGRAPRAALLWIHGGGLVMGAARQENTWCSRVADELGVLVVSVDYRLAPENPYPAALDDCFAALRRLHAGAAALGIDPARIAVGGESAGGGLAAAVVQRAHDSGVPVRFQLLVYPMLDDRTALRVDPPHSAIHTWTPDSNRFAWTSYLGRPPQARDDRPYLAAARRRSLDGLPSAWIGVGDLDLFHDEDVDYARRLSESGVACELRVEPGMYHGADALLDGRAPSMTAFRTAALDALRTALTEP
ncbi:arylesterase [Kitasatospora sp. MMS16-BH015]|uniref:alpha/beta hydrolase n=1 Tax=Kitasatospora sp. MMS16-BH015 TaxID=2018025 RepID=UPI000CA17DA0|nr:alpha/beta hydrolase [Kitasatospora sp. MMS16-BH015]AUG76884.1 arylesterase [Kitasatospora sp. MMS16-BH015]